MGNVVLSAELGLGIGSSILRGGFRTEDFPFLSIGVGSLNLTLRVLY